MAATTAAGASRQAAIAGAVAGIHIGAFILMASGKVPRLLEAVPSYLPVSLPRPPPAPVPRERPEAPEPDEYTLPREPMPRDVLLRLPPAPFPGDTRLDSAVDTAGSVVGEPAVPFEPPALRSRDSRIAALIDACYPAASRRKGEEGRVTAWIVVDASGIAREWALARGSGFPGLDAALGCVVPRLRFHPGRRDGRAVTAEVRLPVVFRLN